MNKINKTLLKQGSALNYTLQETHTNIHAHIYIYTKKIHLFWDNIIKVRPRYILHIHQRHTNKCTSTHTHNAGHIQLLVSPPSYTHNIAPHLHKYTLHTVKCTLSHIQHTNANTHTKHKYIHTQTTHIKHNLR